MEVLTAKQQEYCNRNNITVQNTDMGYIFLIGGVYYQQSGVATEKQALLAGISKCSDCKTNKTYKKKLS